MGVGADPLGGAIEFAIEVEGVKAWTGHTGKRALALIQTGMGPRQAHRAIRLAAESLELSAIFSIGYAGAVDPQLKAGQLLIPTRAVRLEGFIRKECYEAHHLLFQSAVSVAEERAQNPVTGTLATADRFIAEVTLKREIFEKTGALAVDMESAAVAEAAIELRIPVAFVRAISDPADLDLSAWYNRVSGQRKTKPVSPDEAASLRAATDAFKTNAIAAGRSMALFAAGLIDHLGRSAKAGRANQQ